MGRGRGPLDLRRRGRRGWVHRVHLPPQGRAGTRPVDRAPSPPAQPGFGAGRAERVVRRLPPPRGLHRLTAADARRRDRSSRTRDRRTGHRRPEGWTAGTPALGPVRRQLRLDRAGRDRVQPLARAAGALASAFHAKATIATIRAHLIAVPARLARTARRLRMHLPRDWPWETAWNRLFSSACGPPGARAS